MPYVSEAQKRKLRYLFAHGLLDYKTLKKYEENSSGLPLPERSQAKTSSKRKRRARVVRRVR